MIGYILIGIIIGFVICVILWFAILLPIINTAYKSKIDYVHTISILRDTIDTLYLNNRNQTIQLKFLQKKYEKLKEIVDNKKCCDNI